MHYARHAIVMHGIAIGIENSTDHGVLIPSAAVKDLGTVTILRRNWCTRPTLVHELRAHIR